LAKVRANNTQLHDYVPSHPNYSQESTEVEEKPKKKSEKKIEALDVENPFQ